MIREGVDDGLDTTAGGASGFVDDIEEAGAGDSVDASTCTVQGSLGGGTEPNLVGAGAALIRGRLSETKIPRTIASISARDLTLAG
jgi:hypothetical protein